MPRFPKTTDFHKRGLKDAHASVSYIPRQPQKWRRPNSLPSASLYLGWLRRRSTVIQVHLLKYAIWRSNGLSGASLKWWELWHGGAQKCLMSCHVHNDKDDEYQCWVPQVNAMDKTGALNETATWQIPNPTQACCCKTEHKIAQMDYSKKKPSTYRLPLNGLSAPPCVPSTPAAATRDSAAVSLSASAETTGEMRNGKIL